MDYQRMSDEALYRLFSIRVSDTLIEKVDESNRNTVIAVLKITETTNGQSQKHTLESDG